MWGQPYGLPAAAAGATDPWAAALAQAAAQASGDWTQQLLQTAAAMGMQQGMPDAGAALQQQAQAQQAQAWSAPAAVETSSWGAAPTKGDSKGGEDGQGKGKGKAKGFKVRLCTYWTEKGWCKSGAECSFAHGEEDKGRLPGDPATAALGGTSPPGFQSTAKGAGKNHPTVGGTQYLGGTDRTKWGGVKMKMCTYFLEKGECQRGSACTFAHGPEEIGTKVDDTVAAAWAASVAAGKSYGKGPREVLPGSLILPRAFQPKDAATGVTLGDDATSMEIKRLMEEQKKLESEMASLGTTSQGW